MNTTSNATDQYPAAGAILRGILPFLKKHLSQPFSKIAVFVVVPIATTTIKAVAAYIKTRKLEREILELEERSARLEEKRVQMDQWLSERDRQLSEMERRLSELEELRAPGVAREE